MTYQSRQAVIRVILGTAALTLAAGSVAFAQQAVPADQRALVDQLLKRVEELELQVKALQNAAPHDPAEPPAGAPATAAESAPAPNAADMHDMPMPVGLGALQIRGFSDVTFRAARAAGAPNTFGLGQLDLFLSSRLSSQFNTVGEIVFEAGADNAIGVDVERMLLQYSSDWVNIAAGRYHTAIGYYNETYHHGNWFQTAVGRPFIFRFEDDDGILPVHGVGVTAQGRIPSGNLGLRFVAEVSNGRHSQAPGDEAVQNVEDENRHKAVNVALMSRPGWLPGLQAGFSFYHDRLTPAGQPITGESIMAAHVVYQTPVFETLNEVIVIRHAPRGASPLRTTSFYTQVSRQFGRYRPYVRFEYLNVPGADAVFSSDMGRSYGPSIGLRFDPATPVALKVQVDRFKGSLKTRMNAVTVQASFTF